MKHKYKSYLNTITKVEVDERETKHSVWINGKKRAKVTNWDNYHDTWAEAKQHLMWRALQRVKVSNTRLCSAMDELIHVQGLTVNG